MKYQLNGAEKSGNLLLLQMNNSEHRKYLYSLGLPRLPGFKVFENIMDYVSKSLSCKSVLVEEKYIDMDYRNEYSNLYSKTFVQYDNHTTRIHFFGNPITSIDYLRNFKVGSDTINYLGYMILRPTNVGKVGRTILTPHEELDDTFYPLCTTSFSVHLLGHELTIKDGSPFISQDTMVIACAQASIWSAALYLHQKFKFSRYLPFEITENASKSLSWIERIIPTSGLTVYQMLNALNHMKYFPILFSNPTQQGYDDEDIKVWDPVGDIYSYIESRIPVIVSVPNHAITVIGHTFNLKSIRLEKRIEEKRKKYLADLQTVGNSEEKLIFPSNILVNGFIVQDDSIGPYRILPIEDSDYESFQNSAHLLPPEGCNYKTIEDIEHIIVPLPDKIYLLGNDAYAIAEVILKDEAFMQYLNESLSKGNESAREIIIGMDPTPESDSSNPIIIRSYFMDSSEYKKDILREPLHPSLHKEVKSAYSKIDLPHYIWIAEITTVNHLCKKKEEDRFILGEILIDSTANKYDTTKACLSVHLPGFLLTQNQEKGIFNKPDFFDEDVPYRHLSRKSK